MTPSTKRKPVRSREATARRNKERRDRRIAHIRAAKDKPCTDCGHRYPYYVMQFDHVRGEKLVNLSACIAARNGYDVINAEIAKCEVVCANCHAIRTWTRKEALA